jgi:HEAT repeat protein
MATKIKTLGTTLGTLLAATLGTAAAADAPNPLRADQSALGRERVVRVEASSTSAASESGRALYRAANVADGRDWSAWGSVPDETAGAWLKLVFQKVEYVDRFAFVPGDARETTAFTHCGRPARVRVEGGGESRTFDLPDRRWQQVVELSPPIAASSLKFTFETVHGKADFGGVCLSEMKLAGPTDPFAAFPDLSKRIDEAVSFLADDQRFAQGRRALMAIGPPAVSRLVSSLHPENPHLTARLLNVLGELGDPNATHAVAAQLRHRDAQVRDAALWALGAMGSVAHYDALRRWYDQTAGKARDLAFDALVRLGDDRALDVVVAELVGGSPERRESAERHLGQFGAAAVAALRPLLDSTVRAERAAALRALGSVDLPDARTLLMDNLSGAMDSELRAAAIYGLARRADLSAHDAIATLWDSRYLVERQAVAFALGQFAQPEDLETLDLMTTDVSMSVRQAAAAALGALGESARPRLRRLSTLGPDGGTAVAAAKALLGADAGLEDIIAVLGSRHREVRHFAAARLTEHGPVGQTALIDATVTGTDAVRESAVGQLRRLGPQVLPALLEKAPGANEAAQADILRLSAAFKEPIALPHAVRQLTDAQDLVVRRLAVEAISACGDADSAATALIAALDDKAVEVRLAAIQALGHKRVTVATSALVAQLDHPSREVTRAAVLALGQIREQSALDGLAALFHAKQGLDQDDPMLRQDIVASVGRIGGDRSLPVLMDAMADRDVRVRFAAQDVLY